MINLAKRYGTFEGYSYNEAVREFAGSRMYDYFLLLWKWGNIRHFEVCQDIYYEKHGWNGLLKRLNRVRGWYGLPKLNYKEV